MGEGQPPYTEFLLDGRSVAGAMEMNPMVPAQVPSYWMVYFSVDDVDETYRKALAAGAHEMLPPGDFPGGRFAIVSDPQGATFGLLKTDHAALTAGPERSRWPSVTGGRPAAPSRCRRRQGPPPSGRRP